jgi:predicted DNA-binding protein
MTGRREVEGVNDMTQPTEGNEFDGLSPAERAVVGSPEDYGELVRGRAGVRSESAQFSVRIERSEMEALQLIARRRGITFSQAVREAIDRYVGAGGYPGITNLQFSGDALRVIRLEGAELPRLQPNRGQPLPDEAAANLEGSLIDLMAALEESVESARKARSVTDATRTTESSSAERRAG